MLFSGGKEKDMMTSNTTTSGRPLRLACALVMSLAPYLVMCTEESFRPSIGYNTPHLESESPFFSRSMWIHRRLQESAADNSTSTIGCSLCQDAPLLAGVYPRYNAEETGIPQGLSCNDLQLQLQTVQTPEYCIAFRSFLATTCCDLPPAYECATNVKRHIIKTNEAYDTTVPPIVKNPLNVSLVLEFFHISDLDIRRGTTEIFVFVNLWWKDPRLAWNFTTQNCAQTVTVRASLNAEMTEIWVPDFDLLNRASGLQDMDENFAEIYPDGTVLWRRNGRLKALCSFTGLSQIPYDTLGCRFIMGGWTDREFTNFILEPADPEAGENQAGFVFAASTEQNYVEYNLERDFLETGYWTHHGKVVANPVYFDFYFSRSSSFYILKFVIPNIMFAFLSFGVFLLDRRVGERLSYGISVLLVNVASDIVTQQYLPVTEERLWLDVLITSSFYWILFGLIESVFVGYLFFLYDDPEAHNSSRDGSATKRSEWQRQGGEAPTQNNNNSTTLQDGGIVVLPDKDEGSPDEAYPEPTEEQPEIKPEKRRYIFATLRKKMRERPSEKLKVIRKIDMFFFIVIPLTYAAFLIFMFTANSRWALNEDFPFAGETESQGTNDNGPPEF